MSTPTGLTWNTFVQNLANMAVMQTQTVAGIVSGVDDWFNTLLPQTVGYAELRIQRDLDLNALVTSGAYAFVSGQNTLSIPNSAFLTVESLQVTVSGVPVPMNVATKQYVQTVWADPTTTGPPVDFAPYGGDAATQGNTSTIYLIGPYPDQNYPVTVTGLSRMASLYAYSGNSTTAAANLTFISQWLPDLLLQSAMIPISQYQRNFGLVGSDAQMPGAYEAVYQTLLKGAMVEEARKKFQASSWSSESPAVVASPGRG